MKPRRRKRTGPKFGFFMAPAFIFVIFELLRRAHEADLIVPAAVLAASSFLLNSTIKSLIGRR